MPRLTRHTWIAKHTENRGMDKGEGGRVNPGARSAPPFSLPSLPFSGSNPMITTDKFAGRHNGPSEHEVQAMLHKINAPSLNALIDQTIPSAIRLKQPLSQQVEESDWSSTDYCDSVA